MQEQALLVLHQTLVLSSQTLERMAPSQRQVLLLLGCQTLVPVLRLLALLLVHQTQGQMRQECQTQTQMWWMLQSHWVSQSCQMLKRLLLAGRLCWCCHRKRLKQTRKHPCQKHWGLLPGLPLLLLAWLLQHSIRWCHVHTGSSCCQGGA